MIQLIAGNWKMNGSRALLQETVQRLEAFDPAKVQIAICPPFVYLSDALQLFETTPWSVGSQNISDQLSGALTGEISVLMLKEYLVQFCIVGHSERRQYFAETDSLIGKKASLLLEHGIRPIICVGETLKQRESDEHEKVVCQQLEGIFEQITQGYLGQCVVAYEPVWAIGTGKTASAQDANAMHTVIRHFLKQLHSPVADEIFLLYGGSVNENNSQELLKQSQINGALVGGASLKSDSFAKLIQATL